MENTFKLASEINLTADNIIKIFILKKTIKSNLNPNLMKD